MAKLWLTYAWKDNEDANVDHVIAELRSTGLDVRYDRVELRAGRRLWDQIDAGINDPDIAAWAIYVTEASLRSEPCQEELAYALDRALRSRGTDFPLIGIFPEPLDRAIIPSTIATRLYVQLTDPEWLTQITDGVGIGTGRNHAAPPPPFRWQIHELNGLPVVEVSPRSGRWCPFVALVPSGGPSVITHILYGPRGHVTGIGMFVGSVPASSDDGTSVGQALNYVIDAQTSAHISLSSLPNEIHIGQLGGPMFTLSLPRQR